MFWGLLFSCLFCTAPSTDDDVWFDSGDTWRFDSDSCLPWLVLQDADGLQVSDEIDFGAVNHVAQVALPLQVVNLGDCDLTVSNATTETPEFRVDALEWPVLEPGMSRPLVVTFEPWSTGSFTDTLTLFSDDPLQPVRTWTLRGELAPGDVQPDADSVALAPTWVGCETDAAIEWTNAGPGTVTAQTLLVETTSEGLQVASDSLPRELAAGEGLTTLVRYAPVQEETLDAAVTLTLDDGAEILVPVTGEAALWASGQDDWTAGESATYPLSEWPLPDTVAVRVSNVLASGWTYEPTTNAVVFDSENLPTNGVAVSATYAVQPPCPE